MPFPTKRSTNTSDFGDSAKFGGADINAAFDYIVSAITNVAFSFIIYKVSSTYYARDCLTGDISSNATFATLINTVITTVNTAGGGIIFIKAGVYSLTASIAIYQKNNITIQGEGKDSTIIRLTTSTVDMITKNDTTLTTNFALKDMTVDGNDISHNLLNLATNTDGILLQNVRFMRGNFSSPQVYISGVVTTQPVKNVIIRNCDFLAANAGGDLCGIAAENVLVEGCRFSRTVSGGGLTFGYGFNNKIVNNEFRDYNGYGAISLENLNTGGYRNVLIDGNTFKDCSGGFSINGASGAGSSNTFQNITISNNTLIDSGPIYCSDYYSNIVIKGNQLIRSATDGGAAILAVNPQQCVIEGNTINDKLAGTTTAMLAGILILQGDVGEIAHDVTINNNIIKNIDTAGIRVRDTKGLIIKNNQIRDCGGATNNVYYGIFLESWNDFCSVGKVSGNVFSSSLANKLNTGIVCDDSPSITSNFIISENNINDVVTGGIYSNASATGMIIKRNKGHLTENSGTATVASGQTTIVVSHGLAITPSINDIHVTPKNSMGSATKFFVSTVTSTQFTINVNVDPGATTAIFAWTIV